MKRWMDEGRISQLLPCYLFHIRSPLPAQGCGELARSCDHPKGKPGLFPGRVWKLNSTRCWLVTNQRQIVSLGWVRHPDTLSYCYNHLALGFRESLLPSLDVFTAVFATCSCVEGHAHSISFLYTLYSNGITISEVGKSGLWTNLPLGLNLKVILALVTGREVDRTMFSQWCVMTMPFRVDLHSLHKFLVNLYPVPTLG